MDYQRAIEITRFNSGSHFLDSGGAYGRIHESAPPPIDLNIKQEDDWDSITLTGILVDCFDECEALTEFIAAGDGAWPGGEVTQVIMEGLGYTLVTSDNTYNGEQDLDQQFVWAVYESPNVEGDDWIYNDDSCRDDTEDLPEELEAAFLPARVVLLAAHTGCDIRGGYSDVVAGNFAGDYTIPIGLCVEYDIEALDDDDDDTVFFCEEFTDSGYGHYGYSSNPRCHMEYDCKIVFGDLDKYIVGEGKYAREATFRHGTVVLGFTTDRDGNEVDNVGKIKIWAGRPYYGE